MNNTQNTLARIHEVVTKNASGAIVLPTNPSVDAIAAATTLYLGLIKLGKNISIACSQKVQTDLTAGDKISDSLTTGGDNLVISFPYSDGSIDKVDYNIQGANFNLIITPRQGYPKLNPNQVNYNYTGGNVDFIIVIDSPTLNSLGSIYSDNQNLFTGKDIINIDRHLTNSFYGTINHVNKTSSSVSELILEILKHLQIEFDRDMATNLYAGVAASTNNFTSYSVNADTFDNIATLLRYGAAKKMSRKSGMQNTYAPTNIPSYDQSNLAQQPSTEPVVPQPVTKQPQINVSQHGPEIMTKPIEVVEKETKPNQTQSAQDWLKPKIFKGSGLI